MIQVFFPLDFYSSPLAGSCLRDTVVGIRTKILKMNGHVWLDKEAICASCHLAIF